MFPLLGSLITGGASLLGGLFSSETSADNTAANIAMQQQTNKMSMEEAEKNRQFQEQMSSTAYQRANQDMQKAGLNPALMFGSGGPASSPSGSMPSLTAPKSEKTSPFAGLGDAASKAVSSAVQMKVMDKMSDEMANLQTENAVLQKKIDLTAAATGTEVARKELLGAEKSNVEQGTVEKKLDRARQEWEAIKYLDLSGIPDQARKFGNIGSWAGGKVDDVVAPLISSAVGVRRLLPMRSKSQTSHVDSKGNSSDTFTDRWDNLWR